MIKKLEIIATDEDDLMNMQLTKEKLYDVLSATYNKVDEIIAEGKKYYEDRFYSEVEATAFLIEKHQPKLLNSEYETKIIVSFRSACEKAEGKEGLDFIDYISTELTPLISLYCSVEDINDKESYINQIIEMLTTYEIVKRLKNKPEGDSGFIPGSKEDKAKKVILDEFMSGGKVDWEFAFQNETDFHLFVDTLTRYFTNNDYQLPAQTINLRRNCKTTLASILNIIHKKLGGRQLRADEDFLDIIRSLSHYKDDPNLYKTLTK